MSGEVYDTFTGWRVKTYVPYALTGSFAMFSTYLYIYIISMSPHWA